MLNRELQPVRVRHLVSTKDEYGQPRLSYDCCFREEMVIKKQNNAVIPAPTYLDVEYIALTTNFDIDSNYLITVGCKNYRVMYTLPSKKYSQLFLKETNEEPIPIGE